MKSSLLFNTTKDLELHRYNIETKQVPYKKLRKPFLSKTCTIRAKTPFSNHDHKTCSSINSQKLSFSFSRFATSNAASKSLIELFSSVSEPSPPAS